MRRLLALALLAACGPRARDRSDASELPSCEGPRICSDDLQSIACEEDGRIVARCGEGLGCGTDLTCVPACDAAAEHQSTTGCTYHAVAPDVTGTGRGACFAAIVVNHWNSPTTIEVERSGTLYSVHDIARRPTGDGDGLTYEPLENGLLGPGEAAIVFLSGFNCPSTAGTGIVDAALHGTGYGDAFRITTSVPVVAYDLYPFAAAQLATTSATLLLPTTAWGREYIGANAFRKSLSVPEGQPVLAIVAAEDETRVTLRPTADLEGGGGVAPASVGTPATYTLARGKVIQLVQDAELSGTLITSNKPVGVWGGASCLTIDVTDGACDTAHQQLPPTWALGHRYAAVRYPNRFPKQEEVVPWRLVGIVDDTELRYEPGPPPGAPAVLHRGEVVELWAPGPFVVTSQDADHPFYVSAHMTGCARVSPPPTPELNDCRGDPEFVNVVPLDQYLARYTFFTDPTFPETHLILIRERHEEGFADVTVDCAGVVSGWQPIDAAGDREYAYVTLVTGDFASVNGCRNGLHRAVSARPFGLIVWGWGSAATTTQTTHNSYAYPAGASLRPINNVGLLR